MGDFWDARPIKQTQKTHCCDWCKTLLPAKSEAVYIAGVWEGDFFGVYTHPECNDAWIRDPCTTDGEACLYDHMQGKTCEETEEEERKLHLSQSN